MTMPDTKAYGELERLARAASDDWEKHVTATEKMNAARPAMDAPRHDREYYHSLYDVASDRSRDHHSSAIKLAQRSAAILAMIEEIRALRAALEPIRRHYDLNDLDERSPTDALEIPVGDLWRIVQALKETSHG